MKFTVLAGHRYEATIKLGFIEKLASNSTIASKLVDAGLQNVEVTGSGSSRKAIGTSPVTAQVDLPSQIVDVKDLG